MASIRAAFHGIHEYDMLYGFASGSKLPFRKSFHLRSQHVVFSTRYSMADEEKSISERIKVARLKVGLSQTKAARRWGFGPRTLEAWEQGVRNPAGLYREKLERVLRRIEGRAPHELRT